MNYLLKQVSTLSEEQKKLFSKTLKGKINKFRKSWKNLVYYENMEKENQLISQESLEKEMKKYELEIKKFCLTSIDLIDSILNEPDKHISSRIFYKCLKADFYRYFAEVADGEEFVTYTDKSQYFYKQAYQETLISLDPISSLSLNVTLNYALFCYDLLDDVKKAFNIADSVYKKALTKIKDSKLENEIDTLIKCTEENLTIWKIELDDE